MDQTQHQNPVQDLAQNARSCDKMCGLVTVRIPSGPSGKEFKTYIGFCKLPNKTYGIPIKLIDPEIDEHGPEIAYPRDVTSNSEYGYLSMRKTLTENYGFKQISDDFIIAKTEHGMTHCSFSINKINVWLCNLFRGSYAGYPKLKFISLSDIINPNLKKNGVVYHLEFFGNDGVDDLCEVDGDSIMVAKKAHELGLLSV